MRSDYKKYKPKLIMIYFEETKNVPDFKNMPVKWFSNIYFRFLVVLLLATLEIWYIYFCNNFGTLPPVTEHKLF